MKQITTSFLTPAFWHIQRGVVMVLRWTAESRRRKSSLSDTDWLADRACSYSPLWYKDSWAGKFVLALSHLYKFRRIDLSRNLHNYAFMQKRLISKNTSVFLFKTAREVRGWWFRISVFCFESLITFVTKCHVMLTLNIFKVPWQEDRKTALRWYFTTSKVT